MLGLKWEQAKEKETGSILEQNFTEYSGLEDSIEGAVKAAVFTLTLQARS